jgi:hypothetical protein
MISLQLQQLRKIFLAEDVSQTGPLRGGVSGLEFEFGDTSPGLTLEDFVAGFLLVEGEVGGFEVRGEVFFRGEDMSLSFRARPVGTACPLAIPASPIPFDRFFRVDDMP